MKKKLLNSMLLIQMRSILLRKLYNQFNNVNYKIFLFLLNLKKFFRNFQTKNIQHIKNILEIKIIKLFLSILILKISLNLMKNILTKTILLVINTNKMINL